MSGPGNFDLPPKPEKPDVNDCCKSDCEMCIFTVYEKKLAEWEKLCCELRKQECSNILNLPSVLSPMKYSPFQLVTITSLTPDTKRYRFQISEKDVNRVRNEYSLNLNINIGQHLIMKNKVIGMGSIVTRAYTPISNFQEHIQGQFDVLIKVYPKGKMSAYIKTWSVGDIVHWRGPFGNFKYSKNQYKQVIMCCAGTGIAPMFQVIKSIVEDDDEETLVHLLYSCKTYDEILLVDELSHFRDFWNFSCCIFVTREIPKKIRYGETVFHGRIAQNALESKITDKSSDTTMVLICGTDSFNEDIKNFVREIGVLESNIHVF